MPNPEDAKTINLPWLPHDWQLARQRGPLSELAVLALANALHPQVEQTAKTQQQRDKRGKKPKARQALKKTYLMSCTYPGRKYREKAPTQAEISAWRSTLDPGVFYETSL